jgi:hypothetical protein
MYELDSEAMSQEFFPCWQSAGQHLEQLAQAGSFSWLRAHPFPPFLEHLGFRLGNQLFFMRVVDADEALEGPGNVGGLQYVAQGNGGHACLLPMKKTPDGDGWEAQLSGWGLIDATTLQPVDPPALVTDELVEMTDWEVQDMAVQVVRDYLASEGHNPLSWQSCPEVDPSLWFQHQSGRLEWVVVRGVRYPAQQAERPEGWDAIVRQCAPMSPSGHFASVALVNANQPFESEDEAVLPLWRGGDMHVRFMGLE